MEKKNLFPVIHKLSIGIFLILISCSTSHSIGNEASGDEEVKIPIPGFTAKVLRPKISDAAIQVVEIDFDSPIVEADGMGLTVTFAGKEIPLIRTESNPSKEKYIGLVPVPYLYDDKKPEVKIIVVGNAKQKQEQIVPFQVLINKYSSEKLTVDPAKVIPPDKVLARIRTERQMIEAIYKRVTPRRFWTQFSKPVESSFTSVFGTKREFNKELKSFHNGVDFKASVGTPIYAPEKGIVVLVQDLYYTGNTVIIDHGYGLFTIYAHMSATNVKEDAPIEKGALIGKAGSTGRANGPHLHWGVVLSGEKVNPTELLDISKYF